MGVKVFTSQLISDEINEAEIQLLVSSFKAYKETGTPAAQFGRDVSFNRPEAVRMAGLMHIHLKGDRKWGVRLLQFDKTSDTHLVYCQGFFETDSYLLICVVKNAHIKYRDNMFMLNLADIAEDFRNRY